MTVVFQRNLNMMHGMEASAMRASFSPAEIPRNGNGRHDRAERESGQDHRPVGQKEIHDQPPRVRVEICAQ